MSTLLTPSAMESPAQAATPAPPHAPEDGPTPRQFLAGYARILLVPTAGLIAVVTGWTLAPTAGWPGATVAVAGWSLAVAAWLRHRGWGAVAAHLAAWAAPATVLAPLTALGSLSPAGLVVWGPGSALLAIALIAAYDPELVCPPTSRLGRSSS